MDECIIDALGPTRVYPGVPDYICTLHIRGCRYLSFAFLLLGPEFRVTRNERWLRKRWLMIG